MDLSINEGKLVRLPVPMSDLFIANDTIADVQVRSPTQLYVFGKARGNGAEIQRYVYGKIYNAKAYNLCSQMPRLGLSGTLTPEQIKDLVGLLLDPASPVNE